MTTYPLSPAQKSVLEETHPAFDLSSDIDAATANRLLREAGYQLADAPHRTEDAVDTFGLMPYPFGFTPAADADCDTYPLNSKQAMLINNILDQQVRIQGMTAAEVAETFTLIENKLFEQGQEDLALEAYLLNPLACYAVSYQSWLAHHLAR